MASSLWYNKHFSLLTPSGVSFCCLSSPTCLLFLHSRLLAVHSTVDSPKFSPSLTRCEVGGETEVSIFTLRDFFWAGRMTVSKGCTSREWQGRWLLFRIAPEKRKMWWTLLIPCVPESNRIGDNGFPTGGRGKSRSQSWETPHFPERLLVLLPFRFPCLQGCILAYRKRRGLAEGFEFPQVVISNCTLT